MPKAALRSWRIERLICRATAPARMKASSRATTTTAPVVIAEFLASSAMPEASLTALSAMSDSILRYASNLRVLTAHQFSGVMPLAASCWRAAGFVVSSVARAVTMSFGSDGGAT
jgi:hypothetical protein